MNAARRKTLDALKLPVLQLTGSLVTLVAFCNFQYQFPILVCLHALLTTVGIVIFVTEAIAVAVNSRLCEPPARHRNLIVHGALMSGGTLLLAVGICTAVFEKKSKRETVFDDMHAVTGMIATLLLLVASSIALSMLASRSGAEATVLQWLELPHNVCSSLGYGIGMGSLCFGLGSATQVPYEVKVCCAVTCLLITGWTMACSSYDLCRILKQIVTSYEAAAVQVEAGNTNSGRHEESTQTLELSHTSSA